MMLAISVLLCATAVLLAYASDDPPAPTPLASAAAGDAATPPWSVDTQVVVCYLAPTNVDDLGWSFWHNKARLTAHNWMLEDHPALTFESRWFPNFPAEPNKTARVLELLADPGCDILISLSITNYADVPIGTIAAAHPTTQFLHFSRPAMFQPQPPNLAMFAVDIEHGWYVIGAAVGAQTRSCVGMIYPMARLSLSLSGFLRGMRVANDAAGIDYPFYAVELGNFHDPVGERTLSRLFLKKGCDVIISWSDTKENPQLVSRHHEDANGTRRFSVGYGGNVATYTGDSVLVSLYSTLEKLFRTAMVNYMERRYTNHTLIHVGEGLTISELSPLARSGVAQAVQVAKARAMSGADDIFCDPMYNAAGVRLNPDGNCLRNPQRDTFFDVEAGVTRLQKWDSFERCPPGTRYRYDLDMFALHCDACPPNTFTAEFGAAECISCPPPLTSPANASSCVLDEAPSASLQWWGILLLLLTVLLIVAAALLLGASAWQRRNASTLRAIDKAPRGSRLAIAMLGVDRRTTDPAWRRSLDKMCTVYDALGAVLDSVSRRHHIFAFVNVGDVYMLCASKPETMLRAVLAIVAESQSASFPFPVVLRVCCHLGPLTVHDVRLKDGSRKVNYIGREIDFLRSLWASVETNGRLCFSEPFLTECCDLLGPPLPALQSVSIGHDQVSARIAMIEEGHSTPHRRESSSEKLSDSDNPFKVNFDTLAHHHNNNNNNNNTSGADSEQHGAAPRERSRRRHGRSNSGSTSLEEVSPKEAAPSPAMEKTTGDGTASTSAASSVGGDDENDINQYLEPSDLLTKDELAHIRDFSATVLTAFIRVLPFQHQVEVVNAIADKLHIRKPMVPANMNMKQRRSYNVLKNPVRNIAGQIVASMEEMELRRLLDELTEHRRGDSGDGGDDPLGCGSCEWRKVSTSGGGSSGSHTLSGLQAGGETRNTTRD